MVFYVYVHLLNILVFLIYQLSLFHNYKSFLLHSFPPVLYVL